MASLIDQFPLSYYPLSPTDWSSEETLHALLKFGYCKELGGPHHSQANAVTVT